MPEYLSPGVYVEEVDRVPKPIEGVGTAMAAFVGFTERAERAREISGETVVENLLNKPQLVTNWSQYLESYGSFVPGAYLPQSVYGYFMNGDDCFRSRDSEKGKRANGETESKYFMWSTRISTDTLRSVDNLRRIEER